MGDLKRESSPNAIPAIPEHNSPLPGQKRKNKSSTTPITAIPRHPQPQPGQKRKRESIINPIYAIPAYEQSQPGRKRTREDSDDEVARSMKLLVEYLDGGDGFDDDFTYDVDLDLYRGLDDGRRMMQMSFDDAKVFQQRRADTNKAKRNPRRFLSERFPPPTPGARPTSAGYVVVYVWSDEIQKIGEVLHELDLHHCIVPSPIDKVGTRVQPEQVYVGREQHLLMDNAYRDRTTRFRGGSYHILRDEMAGDRRVFKIYTLDFGPQNIDEKETRIVEDLITEEHLLGEYKKHDALVRSWNSDTAPNKSWDVTGTWVINCPDLEERRHALLGHDEPWPGALGEPKKLGQPIEPYTLRIGSSSFGNDKHHLSAEFDFHIYRGILRFLNPDPPNGQTTQAGRFRQNSEYILPKTTSPSSLNPTWHYRWRGLTNDKEGTPVLIPDADKKYQSCSITFTEPGGLKLIGTLETPRIGVVHFEGFKVMNEPKDATFDVDRGWEKPEGERLWLENLEYDISLSLWATPAEVREYEAQITMDQFRGEWEDFMAGENNYVRFYGGYW
jgi:hypothetical protein